MNYLIVDRNISGLSHEWAHSVRTMVSGGVPKVGEPAWMREGFAELMAGMSRVKAFPVRMSYLDFHAIKTHLFTNWPTRCDYSPSNYHARTPTLSDCEYYIGLMGMELLISDFGGLQKLMELCWKANEAIPFEDAFMFVYGLTLAEFEAKAETYIAGIAKIGFISSYVQAPLGFDNA